MPRYLRIVALSLFLWGLIVVFFLPGISTRLSRISRFGEADTEKVAQREVARPAAAPVAAQKAKAKIFWAAADGESLEAVEVELPLSESAEERAHQLLDALITQAPSEARRTLPAAAAVLEVYVLPQGTAIIDFSAAIGASLPSGIRSERLALESVTRTLAENIPELQRVKILLQGLEADTLAGHADLTGYFDLRPAAAAASAPAGEAPAAGASAKSNR